MKHRIAFTLIELVIVIAILGIILGMVMPNSEYFNTLREKAEIREFKRDILCARNKAILESTIYTVSFKPTNNGYIIRKVGERGSVKFKQFNSGIKLNNINNIEEIKFYSNGSVSKSGSIVFTVRNNDQYEITITPVRGLINIKPFNSQKACL